MTLFDVCVFFLYHFFLHTKCWASLLFFASPAVDAVLRQHSFHAADKALFVWCKGHFEIVWDPEMGLALCVTLQYWKIFHNHHQRISFTMIAMCSLFFFPPATSCSVFVPLVQCSLLCLHLRNNKGGVLLVTIKTLSCLCLVVQHSITLCSQQ